MMYLFRLFVCLFVYRSIANRRLLPRIELPDKPVRPLTPYLRYIKENAVNTIVSDQVVQQSNRFKLVKLANIWSTMDDAAKAKYQKGYADEYVLALFLFANS